LHRLLRQIGVLKLFGSGSLQFYELLIVVAASRGALLVQKRCRGCERSRSFAEWRLSGGRRPKEGRRPIESELEFDASRESARLAGEDAGALRRHQAACRPDQRRLCRGAREERVGDNECATDIGPIENIRDLEKELDIFDIEVV
jgi:hypothetical protein